MRLKKVAVENITFKPDNDQHVSIVGFLTDK